jgi:hypothetical protein
MRRRPPPLRRRPAEAPRAQASLELRLVAQEPKSMNMARASEHMLLGSFRPTSPPYAIEIIEAATGRMVGAEPVQGSQGDAHGLYLVMKADLGRMDARGFLRKWGRGRG